MKYLTILIFFELVISPATSGQTVPYERYTSNNSLISDRVTAITQDEKGFMWFGSYFGICRYNGIKFEKIVLPESQKNKFVTCLLSANKKIYAGFLFHGGLAEYYQGIVKDYFLPGKDSSVFNEWICMADNEDGSILLCNSRNQVYNFRDGKFQHLVSIHKKDSALAKSILTDKYNSIWFGSEKGLVIIPYPYKHSRQIFIPGPVYSLSKDEKGIIWITREKAGEYVTETSEGWNGNGTVNLLKIASSGNMIPVRFAGNHKNGSWGIDRIKGLVNLKKDHTPSNYQLPLDFTSELNAVYSDRENNIWIANEPGVIKISNFQIQTFLFNEIAAGGGALWLENDSLVWVTNSKSLYGIINGSIKNYPFKKNPSNYYGLLHMDARDNLWIGFWNKGLWSAKWNGHSWVNPRDFSKFKGKEVNAHELVEDSNGNIWVSGSNGIFHLKDGKILDHYLPKNSHGSPAHVICMVIDEKEQVMWLGDNAFGIIKVRYRFNKENKCEYTAEKFITSKDGLKDMYIRSMFYDHKKDLWVGTRFGGIFRIRETATGFNITDCNDEASLRCTRVTDMAAEDTAALWFATCNGIYRYHFATKKWKNYNTGDGLLNAEVFQIAVDAEKGYIWSFTSQGVTKLNLDTFYANTPPLPSILSITVLGKPDPSALLSETPVVYSHTKNSIGFSFSGASFIDEKSVRYKYILEGFDEEWSDPVTSNAVNYASLPPGNYVFKVMASNSRGQWSTYPSEFRFEIVRPFYKSPWFIFSMILLLVLIIYFIRIQQLKQRYKIEKLRLNIARDLHDDIGSTLGSINILSKTATRKVERSSTTEEIVPIFRKIGHSAEDTLEAMDDIVWSINPARDKMQDILIRMREFAIPLLEAKGIGFDFVVKGDVEQSLPMEIRRTSFMIFKEAIYNTLKHADATYVQIHVGIFHKKYILEITDNGKGFFVDQPTSRNGLKNMRSRAKQIKATLDIASSGQGTRVFFSSPLR